jgi:plasmid stabilization system protein ParE
MPYRVELTERATRDLDALYVEKNASGSPAAARWYNGLEGAVYALQNHPSRCPVAPEAAKSRRPLRHLLYGKKPHVYRVIYDIDEQRQLVTVLTIRHGAREPAELHE